MPTTYRRLAVSFVALLLFALASAPCHAADEILANQNRIPAGKLQNGTLTVHLEIRKGTWHPEAEDGPPLYLQAFAEAGSPAQIPGPLLRMTQGTTIHAIVANKLRIKATVYGLNTRPGDEAAPGTEIPPGESREFTFLAGAPGTYYYWARTTEPIKTPTRIIVQPARDDTRLNGAFIVDPAGPAVPDRIFVINNMFVEPDVIHEDFEVLTINGKSYPYTEALEYTAGEHIRWRVINPSVSEHPMHLHGAFYKILSLGTYEKDAAYPEADRQSLVTQDLQAGQSMMLEWSPEHAGIWLFHCHFHLHVSSDSRVPLFAMAVPSLYDEPVAAAAETHHAEMPGMKGMNDMAGLVLTINVKPSPAAAPPAPAAPPRKIDLLLEPNAADGKSRTFSCSVREGKKVVASQDKSAGPPLIVTRGEALEITVLNHLSVPTAIHWHGLELEAYYDGVIGGGSANQVTPAIPPGGSFVARFTPERAGTFIYHTHVADPHQLSGGVYGALIVLEPGQSFDAEHDRLLLIGTRDPDFTAEHITINGSEILDPLLLNRNAKYRLRVINIAPNLVADLRLGTAEQPATWREIAKDGAEVPARLAGPGPATLHVVSGETYDFEFQSSTQGEIPFQLENAFSTGKLTSKFIVQ